jgi:hypothetical protein
MIDMMVKESLKHIIITTKASSRKDFPMDMDFRELMSINI